MHDPCANRFYQLGWASFEILSRWQLGSAEAVLQAVNADTTLQLNADDIDAVLLFLSRHQLLQAASAEQSAWLWQLREGGRPSHAMWLLKNYLFFRVPLLRPEALLNRLLPWIGWLFHPRFWLAMGGCCCWPWRWCRGAGTNSPIPSPPTAASAPPSASACR